MDKNCRGCNKFLRHFYRRHADPKNMMFYKKMEGMFMHSMRVPIEFSKNLKEPIGAVVHLRVRNFNNSWIVRVKWSSEEMVFKAGWRDFVEANKIQINDLLLFQYCSTSSFEVTVFGDTECVKSIKPDSSRKEKSSGSAEPQTVNISLSKPACTSGVSSRAMTLIVKKEPSELNASPKPFVIPKNLNLHHREMKLFTRMSQAAQPGNPLFVQVLRDSNFSTYRSSYLDIPSRFAKEFLGNHDRTMILQRPRMTKKWNCWYFSTKPTRTNHGIRGIGGNWKNFVKDNNLKVGALCLFELMVGEPLLTMTVHV